MTQTELEKAVGEILIEEDALQARIAELGAEISADYAGRDLLLVGVLKGAVFFMADLMRQLTVPCEIDFMAISSYGAATDSSGVVRILKDLDINARGRHVLVVEDIIDSGLTLSYLMRNLGAREPASLEVCALLTKPERREIDVPVRYVGFEIPNRFVIGYGLDFAERYRNLPYVGVLHADLIRRLRSDRHVDSQSAHNGGAGIPLWVPKKDGATLRRLTVNRFFRSALFPLIVIVLLVYLASQTLLRASQAAEDHVLAADREGRRTGAVNDVDLQPEQAADHGDARRRASKVQGQLPDGAVADRSSRTCSRTNNVKFDSKGTGSSAWWSLLTTSCRSCSCSASGSS